jgi:hypothetical protein
LFFDERDKEESYISREKKSKRKNLKIDKSSQLTENYKTERILGIISVVAGIIALTILIHSYIKYPKERTFGERFVLIHLMLKTPIYNFHFKPITLFVVFALIFWVFGLESLSPVLSKKSLFFKRIIFDISFIFAFVFFYEVFQVFLFWSATYTINLGKVGVDILHTDLMPSGLIVNFTAMTKFYTFILFISLYNLYFFHRIMRIDIASNKTSQKNNS